MAALPFLENRIDPKITQGAQGGPYVVGRTKRYGASGSLTQNFIASMPMHRYDLSHGVRSREDFQSVLDAFYVVMFTPYAGLRYKDWRDFKATQANSKLTLITGATYQLQRKHLFGGVTVLRDIKKPVTGTVVVYRTRSGSVTTATASIDYTTGIATISDHAGGDSYAWAGEFDVPVTFTDDEWTASLEIANDATAWMTSGAIKLEEIRP
jgi:uncharacterized protein (TIGR02217 family)